MNETERHIGTLNQMQSHYSHIRHNDNEFLALEASKEALREKAERDTEAKRRRTEENGCSFCTMKSTGAGEVMTPEDGVIIALRNNNELIVNIRGTHCVIMCNVNNCPVCGRKLKED